MRGLRLLQQHVFILMGVVWALASPAHAATCAVDAGQKDPRPSWIDEPGGESKGGLFAVGVVSGRDITLVDALNSARTQAVRMIAEMIRVDVQGRLSILEDKLILQGHSSARTAVQSITQATTSATLQQVRYDRQWLDAAACRVWVRAFIDSVQWESSRRRAMVDAVAAQIDGFLTQAEASDQTLSTRQGALDSAAALLASPPVPLDSVVQLPLLQARMTAARNAVAQVTKSRATLAELVATHEESYRKYEAEPGAGARKTLALRALQPLRQIAAMFPQETRGQLPFDPTHRLISLSLDAGYPCRARRTAEMASPSSPPLAVSVKKSLQDAKCGREEVAEESRREYMAGKRVHLACSAITDDRKVQWNKPCDTLRQTFGADGATFLRGDQTPETVGADEVFVRLLANGKITAKSKDGDDGGKRFRFDGSVTTQIRTADGPNLDESFQATIGGIPLSEEMLLDVMGVQASKRLLDKMRGHWSNP